MKIDTSLFNDPGEKINKAAVKDVLNSWASFNAGVKKLNVKELYVAFRTECVRADRAAVKQRLIQRIRVKIADQIEAFLVEHEQQLKQGE